MELNIHKGNLLYVYDRVIKEPDTFIMRMISSDKYRSQFEKYIDMSSIITVTKDTLAAALSQRSKENPLEWAAVRKFDYEKNYWYLYKKFPNMYEDSDPLVQANSLRMFIHSFCIDNIYVWNRYDDIRQRYDLAELCGNSKVQYVTGPLDAVLRKFKPNVVYHWSAKEVNDLLEYEEFNNIFFGIANYGFNLDFSNMMLKYNLWKRPNISTFNVMKYSNKAKFRG